MKICKDCKHFLHNDTEGFCQCAALVNVSIVTGETKPVFCSIERQHLNGKCGPDGNLFEAVKPENLV